VSGLNLSIDYTVSGVYLQPLRKPHLSCWSRVWICIYVC